VEDFQDYHNDEPGVEIGGLMDSSPRPHHEPSHSSNHDTDDDEASLSDTAHQSSGSDEAVFDNPSRGSSPRTSSGSEDDISVLESHYEPEYRKQSPFTPLKTRSAFRNPSSVRAMQMETTPPHLASPSSQHRQKLHIPSRQCTPRSARSHRSAMNTPSKISPSKTLKKEYPLVLLHVTLLPIPLVYSQEIMESVLPPSILENWKILQEKATDTVLERGVLIPHPKEDYDLLEERLLESLELRIPRILKCGHFHLSPEEEADVAAESDNDTLDTDANDLDICLDCGRRIRDGKYGSAGTGSKRWDIKLFAANGLMRAGAWSAAWREMERVDVEILPWMEEDMKRELELRKEEEERARREAREEGVGGLDDERLREIYGGDAQAFVDGLADPKPAAAEMPAPLREREQLSKEDIPLWNLFREHIRHAVQDRRNIAIFFLSMLVLMLSMGSFSSDMARGAIQTQQHGSNDNHVMPEIVSQVTEHVLGQSAMSNAATSSASSILSSTTPRSEPEQSPKEKEKEVKDEDQDQQDQEQPSSWTEAAEEMIADILED
jgi:hypothetical protein